MRKNSISTKSRKLEISFISINLLRCVLECYIYFNYNSPKIVTMPAWFMRLDAPVFSRTFADLSSTCQSVRLQCRRSGNVRESVQCQKISNPKHPSDFHPSVTSVLSRITEKIIVRDLPALDSPPATLCFTDQYASRPSGSTILLHWSHSCTV